MKVTARADYAVRAMLELATSTGKLVKADDVAIAQGIPRHFLDNILSDLRRAGLVYTQRGTEGGSRLALPADEITLAQIMRAIEGPLAAVRDVRPERLSYEGPAARLPDVWVAVRAAIRGVLERVTLADVVSGDLPEAVTSLTADPRSWTH